LALRREKREVKSEDGEKVYSYRFLQSQEGLNIWPMAATAFTTALPFPFAGATLRWVSSFSALRSISWRLGTVGRIWTSVWGAPTSSLLFRGLANLGVA
jgi:hypothetical protein